MRSEIIKITKMRNTTRNRNSGTAKPNEKAKVKLTGFIILYLLIVVGFVAIGPMVFSSTWVSSSDFHSCIEISSSFIAMIAAIVCLMYYFGFRSRYYLLCALGFFICGGEGFVHGLLSFTRLVSGVEADLSKFVPGTYVAGRTAFAIFIILAAVLTDKTRSTKDMRKETIFFSSVALIFACVMTALAIVLPLPKFIYPEQLISRPIDFASAILFAIAFVVVLKKYSREQSIFSGSLLACILLNLGGQIYMSFSKQLFDAFFDMAHWANILSYCMPVLGIAIQVLKEIKKSARELIAREEVEKELQEYRDHLEQLVKKRTTELEIVNNELEQKITERKQVEEQREKLLHDMEERVKELRCMYGIATSIGTRRRLEETFHDVVNILPSGLYYPKITCVRIRFDEAEYTSELFKETPWKLRSGIVIDGEERGSVECCYLQERPALDEGPFLREERSLINGIARALSEAAKHMLAAKALYQAKQAAEDTSRQLEESVRHANMLVQEATETSTRLKDMQSQIVQSEKMASIGQLAAGVAHEINTPVGFVASNFETLENYVMKIRDMLVKYEELTQQIRTLGKAELRNKATEIDQFRDDTKMDFIVKDIGELFDDSREGLERVTEIVQNLRDFSRIDQPGSRDEYDINKGIEATLVVARNEIKYDTDVKTELSELPLIFCHANQLNQVFLNILLNAAQAIKSQERDDRGTITIRTYATETGVACEISDDGPGIPPDKISKIFDPFFTTKPAGKGTGLGLSVSYDIIVHKHNGKLFVDSTVGKGTKFTIQLPINMKENGEKEIMSDGRENSIIRG